MSVRSTIFGSVLLGLSAVISASAGAGQPLQPGPFIENGQIIFPEGAVVPKSMTDEERQWLAENPGAIRAAATPPPVGPVVCPGEYGPMQGIILAWEGFTSVVTAMAVNITTIGQADVYIMCDTVSESNTVISTLQGAGANMSRVFTYVVTTDTVWIRDYGPRYIYEGNVRAIVDHTYNRPRPNDNGQPTFWSNVSKRPRYEVPLIHGGGNYHLNADGASWCTRLINNENPTLTESQIQAHWQAYQGVSTTITNPFPTNVDSTQHIDMWMQITGPNTAVISTWPTAGASTQALICDATASAMTGLGWTITRVPAYSVSGTHYTYTNVVMCNNLVLLPTYTNSTVVNAGGNTASLAAWQAAVPGKTIVQVPCQSIVTWAGVMHCICMHVPAPLGGVNPTAYLKTLRGGEILQPGAQAQITWITDDDVGVSSVDIRLSTDGGASYPTALASGIADTGLFNWTVPNIYSTSARVRVVARDAQSNTGFDESPTNFTLNAPPPPACIGDANGSLVVDFDDITAVLANWGANARVPHDGGDANASGFVDFDDITSVLANWGASCP